MVIPLNSPGLQLQGDPPPEAADAFAKLKWCIVGQMGFGACRLFFGLLTGFVFIDLMAIFNVFLTVAMGAFMMKEDPHLARFYKVLSTSIFQNCADRGMGGLSCLLPFLACSALNFIMDVITKVRFIGAGLFGISLMGSIACEAAGAFFAWQVFQVCQEANSNNAAEMQENGTSNYIRATDSARAPALATGGSLQGGGLAAAAGASGSFTVFSGQGNKLGG